MKVQAEALPFKDVSKTHLPQASLKGQSKDVQPIDVDADGDLDLIIAHENKPNILLIK